MSGIQKGEMRRGLKMLVLGFLTLHVLQEGDAATWVVDKNVSNAPDFTSLQTALETAAAGDTIYLAPAGENYGNIVIEKSITIIGSGFGKPASSPGGATVESRVREVTVAGAASDVFLSGLVFSNNLILEGGATGVTLFRNHFWNDINTRVGEDPLTNLVVVNNRVGRVLLGGVNRPRLNGMLFANNICGNFQLGPGEAEILNNVFAQSVNNNHLFFSLETTSGIVENNILIFSRFSFGRGEAAYSGNLYDNGGDPSGRSIFISFVGTKFEEATDVVVNTGEFGARYILAENSPAKGAGTDGSDIGIFGGPHPWNLNHQPPIPFISRFDAPTLLGAGESLKITIEAQSNN